MAAGEVVKPVVMTLSPLSESHEGLTSRNDLHGHLQERTTCVKVSGRTNEVSTNKFVLGMALFAVNDQCEFNQWSVHT